MPFNAKKLRVALPSGEILGGGERKILPIALDLDAITDKVQDCFAAAHPVVEDVPAEKYVTKSTVLSRSLVSVKDDMPRSNLPAARPGMIPSKPAFWTLTLRPSSLPIA